MRGAASLRTVDDPNTLSSSVTPIKQAANRIFAISSPPSGSSFDKALATSFLALKRRNGRRGSLVSLAPAKLRLPLGVEGFDAFAEIIRLAQAAVAMAL